MPKHQTIKVGSTWRHLFLSEDGPEEGPGGPPNLFTVTAADPGQVQVVQARRSPSDPMPGATSWERDEFLLTFEPCVTG
jgi:hypothetical protein